MDPAVQVPSKLFIGGLAFATTNDGLKEYFSRFGPVAEAAVVRDADKRSRGFGFVIFRSQAGANAALASAEHTIDGRRVEAKRAVPREAGGPGAGGAAAAGAPAASASPPGHARGRGKGGAAAKGAVDKGAAGSSGGASRGGGSGKSAKGAGKAANGKAAGGNGARGGRRDRDASSRGAKSGARGAPQAPPPAKAAKAAVATKQSGAAALPNVWASGSTVARVAAKPVQHVITQPAQRPPADGGANAATAGTAAVAASASLGTGGRAPAKAGKPAKGKPHGSTNGGPVAAAPPRGAAAGSAGAGTGVKPATRADGPAKAGGVGVGGSGSSGVGVGGSGGGGGDSGAAGAPPAAAATVMNATAPNTRKIFVGGLHYGTTDAELRRYFSQYGRVETAQVMYNRETNKSRGFGFVIFEEEAAVERSLVSRMQMLDNKEVEVKAAVPKAESQPSPKRSGRGARKGGGGRGGGGGDVGVDGAGFGPGGAALAGYSPAGVPVYMGQGGVVAATVPVQPAWGQGPSPIITKYGAAAAPVPVPVPPVVPMPVAVGGVPMVVTAPMSPPMMPAPAEAADTPGGEDPATSGGADDASGESSGSDDTSDAPAAAPHGETGTAPGGGSDSGAVTSEPGPAGAVGGSSDAAAARAADPAAAPPAPAPMITGVGPVPSSLPTLPAVAAHPGMDDVGGAFINMSTGAAGYADPAMFDPSSGMLGSAALLGGQSETFALGPNGLPMVSGGTPGAVGVADGMAGLAFMPPAYLYGGAEQTITASGAGFDDAEHDVDADESGAADAAGAAIPTAMPPGASAGPPVASGPMPVAPAGVPPFDGAAMPGMTVVPGPGGITYVAMDPAGAPPPVPGPYGWMPPAGVGPGGPMPMVLAGVPPGYAGVPPMGVPPPGVMPHMMGPVPGVMGGVYVPPAGPVPPGDGLSSAGGPRLDGGHSGDGGR